MSEKQNIKTLRPAERIARAWRLALEFGAGYPVGKSEREKLVDHAPIGRRCGSCGRSR